MSATKLDWINNSDHILNDKFWESDLSDCFLAEGSKAQLPLKIDRLEINMESNKLSKNQRTKEQYLRYIKANHSSINLSKKELFLRQIHSQGFKSFKLSKENYLQQLNVGKESSKLTTSIQNHLTLKDEIKFLLNKLAKERKVNSEWKPSNLLNDDAEVDTPIFAKTKSNYQPHRVSEKWGKKLKASNSLSRTPPEKKFQQKNFIQIEVSMLYLISLY